MDLQTGWDFSRKSDQERAWKYLVEEKPKLLIGSPMCTIFSVLQNLSRWTAEKQERWKAAVEHLKFACKLYRHQIKEGRWFLHEHPVGASSWKIKEVSEILRMEEVNTATADQCMYGPLTPGTRGKKTPARKRTRFMSNSPENIKGVKPHVRRQTCTPTVSERKSQGGRGVS